MPAVSVHSKDAPEGVLRDVHVSCCELKVLTLLGQECFTAPQISQKSGNKMAVQSVYSLLKRLEKKNLVSREDITINVHGIRFKRVLYFVRFDHVEVWPNA